MSPATILVIGEPDAIRPYVEELSTKWLAVGSNGAFSTPPASIAPNRSEAVVVELDRAGGCVVRLGEGKTCLGVWPSPGDLTAIVALVMRFAELDRQLRVMEETEPLGVLACCTAHDVNNLLLVVLASLGELARLAPERRAPSAVLANAEAATRRIAALMRRMLSFGRDGSARAIDLNGAVLELLPILRSVVGPGIVVQEALSPTLPKLRCDVVAIEQVSINLCANARDALPLVVCPIIRERIMGRGFAPPRRVAAPPLPCSGGRSPPPEPASPVSPPSRASRVASAAELQTLPRIDCYFWDAALGGNVVISTRAEALPASAPSAASNDASRAWIILEVRDDGTGMLPETLARAFEPLFTTKPPERGTGLGLKSVRRIVSRAGGSVHLQSKPGEGTTVTLRWPAQP